MLAPRVMMYSTRFCPYCNAAKQLLGSKQVEFEDIPVDGNPELRAEMTVLAGGISTVPQIWLGETHIGGYTELAALEQSGQLDDLLRVP